MKTLHGALVLSLCTLAAACDGPTGPSAATYAGEWRGTTAEGQQITFTISAGETVTAITIGHQLGSCSAMLTFGGLNLSIAPQVQCIPAPCSPSVSSYRAFGYSAGTRGDEPATALNGVFLSTTRAEGTANFRNWPGCSDAVGVPWSATRR